MAEEVKDEAPVTVPEERLSLAEARKLGPPHWTTRKRILLPLIVLLLCLVPQISIPLRKAGFLWFYVLIFSWALSTILTPLAIRGSFLLGWLDIPQGRKDHAKPTPVLGGAAIIGAFGITLLMTFSYSLQMKGVGIASLLIWLVGVLDDRWELPASLKLLMQVVAVGILIFFGVRITFLPNSLLGNIGEYLLTFLWVIGITNAVNFLDGMDGLAAGMSAIIAALLGVVALQTGQLYFTIVAVALVGACIGFLPFNFRRTRSAEIFLGDNGATFLGFTLAATAILADWADNNVAAIAVPVLLLGVPIFDMTMTTVIRFYTGRVRTFGEWLRYAGRDHFHHRLAALGIGRYSAVLVIYAVTIIIGLPAVVLKQARGVDAVLLLTQGAFILLLISFFMIYVRNRQIRLFVEQQEKVNDNPYMKRQDYERILTKEDRPSDR